ncbi:MAG: hypothetical protein HY072_08915, partial [Deltaproteobacteria bacterium]|nr:hypothetical protein [Deltaproteobacteria bacterium]
MFAHRNDRAFTYLISISLFLGAFFCLFLAKQIHTINRTQSVSIDLKQIFWWKDAKFNFDQTQIASTTVYPEIKTKITPIRLIKKISKQVHHIKLQKFDKIITQSAAAVEQTEQQKLLSVYKLLRTKFILAVNTHDETSHALATLISHTNPNATPKVVPKIIPKPTISIMPNVISKAIPKIISNTIQNTIPSSITNIINNKQDTENKKPSDKFFNNFSSNSNFPIVAKKKEQQRVPEYRVNNVIDHQTEPHVGNLANKSVVAKSNTTPIDSGFSVSL